MKIEVDNNILVDMSWLTGIDIENHIWITAKKEAIPVCNMSTKHIQNCIKCWKGEGRIKIPTSYLGGKKKWLRIFENELIKRN